MPLIISVAPVGALIVKEPSVLVEVPFAEPFTRTLIPGMPLPAASVTFPVTVFCALEKKQARRNVNNDKNFFKLFIMQFFGYKQ